MILCHKREKKTGLHISFHLFSTFCKASSMIIDLADDEYAGNAYDENLSSLRSKAKALSVIG